MANEFIVRKGLIVEGASGGTVVDIQGSQGQLFSVTDDLSGSIFAVSDISGVPIFDVNSSGVSYFDGTVEIGTSTVATANAAADDLWLRSTGSNGITISSGNAQTGTIFFGDVANAAAAGFRYNHNTGDMAISAEDNITFACDNVGIGTTDPTTTLSVKGTSSNGINIIGVGTTATRGFLGLDASNHGYLSVVSSASGGGAVIKSIGTSYFNGGNVGIGTTDPDDRLDVIDGNAQMVFGTASSDRSYIQFKHNAVPVDGEELVLMDFSGYNDASQSTRYVILTSKAEDVTDGSEDGSLTFQTMAGGTATQSLTMRSGQVGIGTDNPAQKLDIVGKMKISDDIILAQTNGRIDYDNGVSSGALRFWSTSGNTERMRITSAGNVGIGTTDPVSTLVVSKNQNGHGITIDQENAGDGYHSKLTFRGSDGSGGFVQTAALAAYQTANGANGYLRLFGATTEGLRVKTNGSIQLPTYGAGYLQTDASGNITSGTVTTSDTLDNVTDNGNSTTNSIVLGASTTNGTMLVRGTYASGNIVVIGGMKSSGGAMIGYAVKPDTANSHGFVSSSAFTLERSAYYQQGNRHRWYAGASQDAAIGNAVTMSETMRLDFDKLGLSTSSPASLIHLGKSTNGSNIITFGEAGIGGPHGLNFYGDDATRTLKYSIYYRTNTENISIETSDGTKRFDINQSGAVTFNEAFTFPTADGGAGSALITDGSGALSWNAGYKQYSPVGWAVLNNQTYTSTGANISSSSTQAQAGTTPVQRNSATEFEATKQGWYEISYSFLVKNNYTNRAMVGAYMTVSTSGGGGIVPGSHSTQYVRYNTYGEYAQIQNTFYYYTAYASTNFYLLAYLLSGSMNMTTQSVNQSMISFRYINNDIT
jgi:hypothetical protein